MKNIHHAACPHFAGMRIDDLLAFLKTHKLQDYLPTPTRTGSVQKNDRDWLMNVSQVYYFIYILYKGLHEP